MKRLTALLLSLLLLLSLAACNAVISGVLHPVPLSALGHDLGVQNFVGLLLRRGLGLHHHRVLRQGGAVRGLGLLGVGRAAYVLVDIGDVWSESVDEAGNPVMVRNTLYLPEGKKPLIFSYDDTNYYPYMLENGLTYKLIACRRRRWQAAASGPAAGQWLVSCCVHTS